MHSGTPHVLPIKGDGDGDRHELRGRETLWLRTRAPRGPVLIPATTPMSGSCPPRQTHPASHTPHHPTPSHGPPSQLMYKPGESGASRAPAAAPARQAEALGAKTLHRGVMLRLAWCVDCGRRPGGEQHTTLASRGPPGWDCHWFESARVTAVHRPPRCCSSSSIA